MKKYRVTEKHPFYKTDITIEDYGYSFRKVVTKDGHILEDNELDITESLKIGWIEEIQEPEFTKEDMIIFGIQCYNNRLKKFTPKEELDNFIKTKNENQNN